MLVDVYDLVCALPSLELGNEGNKIAIRPNRHFHRPTKEESKVSKGIKSAAYQKHRKKMVF